MANLNLSEFTEKLFVADADHTFIWDSAASISKRVSRNSWLNSGTLTSDAPVTISQTWNAVGQTFKALVVNAAGTSGTNSASGSLLLDLQVGGISKFNVRKDGLTELVAINLSGGIYGGDGNWWAPAGLNVSGASYLSFGPADIRIYRDGAGQLALRNGAAAQTFNVYGTSSASNANYARLALTCGLDGNATISTQALGTGTAGTVSINGVPVGLGKGNISSNVAIGTGSLNANTTGTDNVAVGFQTLNLVSGNYENVAVGYTALKAGGFRHVAIGYGAAQAGQANDGVDIGWAASFNRTSGALNTIVGRNAARTKVNGGVGNLTNFSNCVLIGSDVKAFDNGDTNEIVIGYDATGIGSNSVVLGNDSITKTALKGNVGIGTTSPTSKLHVAGNSSPTITVDNTLATGASQLLFKNTVVTGDTDGIFLNGSTQTGFGGAGSLNIKATTGPLAFHTASVTNALSIAQSGAATFSSTVVASSFYPAGVLGLSHNGLAVTLGANTWKLQVEGTLLCFSGVTASFPAFKRVGAEFQVVNAGTTAALNVAAPEADLTFIEDRYRRKGAGTPEGVVTAPIGAVYHNTTGGAGTSFYVKESGTGNTGWVGK